MTAGVTDPKSTPEEVVAAVLEGIEAGAEEVLADEVSRTVKANLSDDLARLYPGCRRATTRRWRRREAAARGEAGAGRVRR